MPPEGGVEPVESAESGGVVVSSGGGSALLRPVPSSSSIEPAPCGSESVAGDVGDDRFKYIVLGVLGMPLSVVVTVTVFENSVDPNVSVPEVAP
jgi:hypothetical protein